MSKAGDPRLGDLLNLSESGVVKKFKVAILGYPCDIGVARNGGRVGAKHGPEALRKKLPKLGPLINPEFNVDLRNIQLVDQGDLIVSENLEKNHETLSSTVQSLCEQGYICVIVGGGNDQSYCNAKGLMNSKKSGDIGVVNIDAHLDVRPLLDGDQAHSGSPFRQLLEDNVFKGSGKFCEFAVQGNQCSADHADFVTRHNGKLIWLSQLRESTAMKEFQDVLNWFGEKDTFVSFDIDSIQGADCPGVSCPSVIGLTAQEALNICLKAGRHSKTRLLDLSEFNPEIEEDRTARLVSNMIYYFLMGVSSRFVS